MLVNMCSKDESRNTDFEDVDHFAEAGGVENVENGDTILIFVDDIVRWQ